MVVGSPPQNRLLALFVIQRTRIQRQQVVFFFIPKHRHQRRIGIQKLPFGCAEVNAFLQGFEQFSKAQFLFALLSNVTPKHAQANNFVTLHNGIEHAIEIKKPRGIFQFHFDGARPVLLVQEVSQAALRRFARRFVDEVVEVVPHQVGISDSRELRYAFVHGSQCAVERNCAGGVFK